MAQIYQFLASGGEIQPLHAVRGVLDANGKALNRYDEKPQPAQAGDAIAARLVTSALQQAVSSGTGRQLVSDGLGRLQPAGKTGTSNDSRDSWFAGWTGDHLAVIWVGNDQNAPTGLYGATGAMRVWSGLFSRLPSAQLQTGGKGIDWQWVVDGYTTDAGCPGARRIGFVSGFAPAYQPCVLAEPEAVEGAQDGEEPGFWRKLFGIGERESGDDGQPKPEPQPQQQPNQEQRRNDELRRQQLLRDERDRQDRQDEEDARYREQQAREEQRIQRDIEQRYAEVRAREEEFRARRQREEEEADRRERERREREARDRQPRARLTPMSAIEVRTA
jgi:membrane peptidoglycan carboxypeptidase